jgi:hypothetical protein
VKKLTLHLTASHTAWPLFSLLGLGYFVAPGIFLANQLAWSMAVLLITNVFFWVRAQQQIEIMGLLPQLAILMLWCMPALHYWLVANRPGIMDLPMPVDAAVYFGVAVPGVLALCWAYFLPLPGAIDVTLWRDMLKGAIQGIGSSPCKMAILTLLSLFGYFAAAFVLPTWMLFLGTICRSLLYVLVLVVAFHPTLRGRYYWILGLATLLITDLLRSTMFGEIIGVLAILLLYAVFVRQWPVWKILVLQLFFGLLLYWLLSFKYEYRKMAGENNGFSDRIGCLIKCAAQSVLHPVTPKILDVVVSRLNQGSIMGLAIKYVPAQQPFVHGETIWTAVKGALIPRLLWPDKPKAGGVENVRRFMGIENLHYSINLGVVGEAYVNYGTGYKAVCFLLAYVLFFRMLLILMLRQSLSFPFLLLLLPAIFFIVNFVEKDVSIVLNHVVKMGMVLGVFWVLGRRALHQKGNVVDFSES